MKASAVSRAWEKAAPYILLAPFIFHIVAFFGYAFARTLYFSFTEYNLFASPRWVGVRNYVDLFRNVQFGRALKNSIQFAVIVTLAQTFLALILAVVMNSKVRGIRFFRAAYYMPSVTSSVVITLIFMWLFQRGGVINYLTTRFIEYRAPIGVFFACLAAVQVLLVLRDRAGGWPASWFEPAFLLMSAAFSFVLVLALQAARVIGPNPNVEVVRTVWLNTRQTVPGWAGSLAFPRPLAAIMMLNTWTTAPTMMLLFLAGLQDIPRELYEAAAVDGAAIADVRSGGHHWRAGAKGVRYHPGLFRLQQRVPGLGSAENRRRVRSGDSASRLYDGVGVFAEADYEIMSHGRGAHDEIG